MNSKLPLTAIVLTCNEQVNLPDCLKSITNYVDDIVVVDSFSTDNTLEIAKGYTDKIYQDKFANQAKKFIWALENTDIKHEWIVRVDADERWTKEGFAELKDIIDNDRANGVYVKMKIYFMDRWIKHGGLYPNYFLRVYKKSKGFMEDRWMDEHITVNSKTIISNIDVIELNYDRQRNISLWTEKHNDYSTRETITFLLAKHKLSDNDSIANLFGNKTKKKRWLKENIYFKMPLFVRPLLYFIYRYFFLLGFLDGKEGFIFHTLHAFWYRFLVDAKIYQIEKIAKNENKSIRDVLEENYGIKI